jgi:membrane fusion protein, heavy metal efflux system
LSNFIKRLQMFSQKQLAVGAALLGLAGAVLFGFAHSSGVTQGHSEVSSQSRKGLQRYTPTPAEWASLTIEPVTERTFRAETVTEGKVAVDAGVFALCRPCHETLGPAGRQRHARAAAVRD